MTYKKAIKKLSKAASIILTIQKAYRKNRIECVNKDDCTVDNNLTVAEDMIERTVRVMGSKPHKKFRISEREE